MGSGYYFTNLMSNGLSSAMGYDNGEHDHNTQPDEFTQTDYTTQAPDDTTQAPDDSTQPDEDEFTQPDDTTEAPDDMTQPEAPSAKGSLGRTKNFSVQEDLLLVSGWLNVSMDGINGADQSKHAYWKRVHAYYHLHKNFTYERSQGSLMNRWSAIRHDVNAFCGCISKMEARNQSGSTVDDKIAGACAMFKEDEKTHKNFAYIHCWKVLKDKPKWIQRNMHTSNAHRGAKKQKTSADASPSAATLVVVGTNVDGGQPSGSAQERPPGKKKKELQRLRQRASMEAMEFLVAKRKEADAEKDLKKEERCKKAFALHEERIRIERQRVDFKMQLEEERIMNIDLTTLNYKQQQYYERRQEEILAKRLNN